MNTIITIGRQFGSGGREFGKRLADELGIPYYDKEIVEEISKRTQLAQGYVKQIVEQKPGIYFPITTGRTLHAPTADYIVKQHTSVYAEQANVLREMAEKSNCIIVGRCAEYVLRDHPGMISIFITSDNNDRIGRIMEKEGLDYEKAMDFIEKGDKRRRSYHDYYATTQWGEARCYDICINSSKLGIEGAVALLHAYISNHFAK